MYEPLRSRNGFLPTYLAFFQRVFWRITSEEERFDEGCCYPSQTSVRWVSDKLLLNQDSLKFRIAVCHLSSHFGFEIDWPQCEPYTTLSERLNSPKVANHPLMSSYWSSQSMNLPLLVADNIFCTALDQNVHRVLIDFLDQVVTIEFVSEDQSVIAGQLPQEIKNDLFRQLRIIHQFRNPFTFPKSALKFHESSLVPAIVSDQESKVEFEFVPYSNWLADFGASAKQLIEMFREMEQKDRI